MSMKHHCTVYGALGCFIAIFCSISLILVNTKEQECIRSSYDQLQAYNAIGLVAGVVLAVSSFFNFAHFLHEELEIVFYFAVGLITFLGGLMGYSAAYSFWRPCVPVAGVIPVDKALGLDENRNVFGAEDGQMIAVFFLQVLAAIGFILSAANFYKRV